jgi:hypothetical protein
MLNYQGKLTNPSGNPVPDSTYSVTFRLFTDSIGSSAFWNETKPIETRTGLFNCLLGSTSSIPYIPSDGNCFLEMQVNSNPPMTPRIRLVSTAYSYVSRKADSANYAASSPIIRPITPSITGDEIAKPCLLVDTSPYPVLWIRNIGTGHGLVIDSAGDCGVRINRTYYDGLSVDRVGYNGIRVWRAGVCGVLVDTASAHGFRVENAGSDGFSVGKTVYNGLRVGRAGGSGVLVDTARYDGIHIDTTGVDGVSIRSVGNNGVYVGSTGVDGVSIPNVGNNGVFIGSAGVDGIHVNGAGNNGVYASGNQYAGYFNGNFLATNGTKSAGVKVDEGDWRLLYCQESPEVWFEDVGEGQLKNGTVHIELDQIFLKTVTITDKHPMKVFVQLCDDCNGVFVKRGITGFDVIELQNGNSNARFTYRVMAKRRGYENLRLKKMEQGRNPEEIQAENAKRRAEMEIKHHQIKKTNQ